CAQIGGGFGSGCAITNSFAVGGKGLSGGGFLFVEDLVEEDDLAGNFFSAHGLEFVESVDNDHIGGQAIGGSRRAASQRGKDNLLAGIWNHSCVLDQGCRF